MSKNRLASVFGLMTAATLAVLVLAGACGLPLPTEPAAPELDRTPDVIVASEANAAPPAVDQSAEPTFTPYTRPPTILNRDEIIAALIDRYPALLREAGIGGRVRVYFHIDGNGTVTHTRIDQSSGHPALDDAALAVASVYRFSPALNGEQPTPVWVSFPITFQAR
ncbi:MAG TPA: energy transducer TonB [Longimicrobiales bacterium]|nr:energy transducer TonB [Longimicrobiales bacterium]